MLEEETTKGNKLLDTVEACFIRNSLKTLEEKVFAGQRKEKELYLNGDT